MKAEIWLLDRIERSVGRAYGLSARQTERRSRDSAKICSAGRESAVLSCRCHRGLWWARLEPSSRNKVPKPTWQREDRGLSSDCPRQPETGTLLLWSQLCV